MSSKPYKIKASFVAKSPFANVEAVRDALRKHRQGKRIGFTATSSLKAMGLVKRSDGTYKLGPKYTRQ